MLIATSKISKISFAQSPLNSTEIVENIFASDSKNYQHTITINRNQQEIAKFQVAKALDNQQKMLGLMHIKSLPKNHAMLFTWESPQIINMWMKNTKIPLDMLFLDEKYQIIKIHSMAKPFSLDIISSQKQATAVLEINGGLAKKLKINLGDQLIL